MMEIGFYPGCSLKGTPEREVANFAGNDKR